MQFAGLRKLVGKSTATTASGASAASSSLSAADDPYAIAVQTVRAAAAATSAATAPATATTATTTATTHAFVANEQQQRQQQQQHEHEQAGGKDATAARKRARSNSKSSTSDGDGDKGSDTHNTTLLSRDAFEQQRTSALHTLTHAMHDVAMAWARTHTTASAATAPVTGTHAALRLPHCVQSYLLQQYVDEDASGGNSSSSAAAAAAEAYDEEAQHAQLLDDLAREQQQQQRQQPRNEQGGVTDDGDEGEEAAAATAAAAATPACVALSQLLHVLWYITAAHWRRALSLRTHTHGGSGCGVDDADGDGAWCYEAYLLSRRALPADTPPALCRRGAAALERWRAAAQTRRGALELLAYLLSDYRVLTSSSRDKEQQQQQQQQRTNNAASTIVPRELREGLVRLLVRHVQQARAFARARQEYVDLTLGNANWKLGLFSAGEVHMRRSIARVERNRIAHLLNNEHALQLLHAVRELALFAEGGLDARDARVFFAAA